MDRDDGSGSGCGDGEEEAVTAVPGLVPEMVAELDGGMEKVVKRWGSKGG